MALIKMPVEPGCFLPLMHLSASHNKKAILQWSCMLHKHVQRQPMLL